MIEPPENIFHGDFGMPVEMVNLSAKGAKTTQVRI